MNVNKFRNKIGNIITNIPFSCWIFFKGIIEKNELDKIKKIVFSFGNANLCNTLNIHLCDLVFNRMEELYYLIALDSMFIFIANGLIIIFEMGNSELGILALLAGILGSHFR